MSLRSRKKYRKRQTRSFLQELRSAPWDSSSPEVSISPGTISGETGRSWHMLEAGELFGEAYACMPGESLMVNVEAAEKCRILFLDIGKILNVCTPACSHHNRLIHNLLYIMAKKNLMLTRKIDHMGQRSIREKVMAYLSFESEKQKKKTFGIPFNRQQLADYLAVDRSALSAELSRMKKDGLIEFEKNIFTLL